MSETLHQRKTQNSVGSRALSPLEDFQSRIHSDPNDKPQIDEPLVTPNPTSLTLTWNEIPPWQQDNEYILSGYRRSASQPYSLCALKAELSGGLGL